MNVPELSEKLLHHLRTSGNAIGLVSSRTQVAYVLNWGGFVNASFSVTDGQKRLHLKLAKAGDDQSALRRWQSVHRRLEERYHAPRVIGWIDVAGTAYGGLVFEQIDGEICDARQSLD